MAGLAVIGVLVNGAAVLRLRGEGTLNAQTMAWHLLEDVLGWIAVLVVSVVLLFVDAPILDPVLSILITAHVLVNMIRRLRETLSLFLQAVPEDVDLSRLEYALADIDKVLTTHHTHMWSLDGVHHVLTTHLVVEKDTTREEVIDIKGQALALVDNLDLAHTTIEIEYEGERCRMHPSAATDQCAPNDSAP
jgi:cobalt-zinc-cadmium efflux system protein